MKRLTIIELLILTAAIIGYGGSMRRNPTRTICDMGFIAAINKRGKWRSR